MFRRALFVALLLCSTSVFGQSVRTWVSNAGLDGGSCGLGAPCRTFEYALTVTASGGDIVALNSGGFGNGLNINKAVNIIVPDGIYAAISTLFNNQNGITISAGINDVVRIKGLNVLGVDTGSTGIGIYVGVAKRVELDNLQISRIATGVKVVNDTRVHINRLYITETNIGIWSIGSQTPAAVNGAFAPPLKVSIMNTRIIGTGTGVKVDSGSIMMVQGNTIAHATTITYTIASIVTNCSQISLNSNSDSNVYFNNNTGTQDGRNGMNNNGYEGCQTF